MKRKGGQAGNSVKKAKKDEDDISKKILSKYDKINEELNKAVATYLSDGDVKLEANNESETFSELIRSKLGDLEDDHDSDDDGMISPDRSVVKVQTQQKSLKSGPHVDEIISNVSNVIVGDIEKIKGQVIMSLERKNREIMQLKEKVQKCEIEKTSLNFKYKKYKEMAIKLSANASGSDSKDLEEENIELKEKLKTVLDKLGNSEECKADVNSKLALKDMMLKEQLKKNQDLETKIKSFVMRFFEKMEISPQEGAASNLSKSMEESKISSHLEKTNKSLHKEISSKFALHDPKKGKVSTDSTDEQSPRIKEVEVKLQNVGVDGWKRGNDARKGDMKNERNYDVLAIEVKNNLSFGVLKDDLVNQSSLHKLISETSSPRRRLLSAALSDSVVDEGNDQEGFKKKRKNKIKELSNEISKKKFEIKRHSTGMLSPVPSKENVKFSKESFEVLPSGNCESEVPLKVKIVNMSSQNTEVYAKSIGEQVKMARVARQDVDTANSIKSSRSLNTSPKVVSSKNVVRDLPSNLLGNSSISIERGLDAPKVAARKEVNKVAEAPFNLPGISFSKSSSLSVSKPPGQVTDMRRITSGASLSTSMLSVKKVNEAVTSSPVVVKGDTALQIDKSMLSFSKVKASQHLKRSSVITDSMQENPALNNLNLSVIRSGGGIISSPKPSLRCAKPARNPMSSSQLSISKASDAVPMNVGVDASTREKVSLLRSNSSISISSNIPKSAKAIVGEGRMVEVAADVLKEVDSMETSLNEDIPWEASDSQLEESAITENDDFGLTDYNSLMSKIDNQLRNISEQNQQFELKKKQMENDDDEIEKLLMD